MKRILLAISLSLIVSVSYSQDVNNQLLKKLIEKEILTEKEAKEIEEESAKEASENKTYENDITKKDFLKLQDIISTRFFKPGGYALFDYTYNNTKDAKHDLGVRAVYLTLQGEAVKDISYLILLNLANPALTEYRVDWSPKKELKFRIGQQKVPISMENQLSLATLEYIQSSRAVDYLVGGPNDVLTRQGDGKVIVSSGRDIGIKMFGELFENDGAPLIEYHAGVYQGSGINRGASRSDKDFVGSILFSPFKGFRIGGGASIGGAVYEKWNETTPTSHVRNRWVLNGDYKFQNFYARAEWIKGNDGGIGKEGLYALGTWSFVPEKWVALAKVDYYNNNKSVSTEVYDYLVGINYYITQTWRIQGNYTYSDYSKRWGQKNSHVAEVQFQIVF